MENSDTSDEGRSVSIGRIFSRAFGVMGHNPGVAFGIAFLFGALPSLIVNYLLQGFKPDLTQSGTIAGLVAFGLIVLLVGLILQSVVQGALVRATIAESQGRRAGFAECVGDSMGRVLPLVAVAVLLTLGFALGMLLLIVPGVILLVMWSVAIPLVVAERASVGTALARSRELTKGARWKIFGLFLLLFVVMMIVAAVLGVVMVALVGVDTTAATLNPVVLILNAVIKTILLTFGATTQTSLYVELRNWKDGPATQTLGEIFG